MRCAFRIVVLCVAIVLHTYIHYQLAPGSCTTVSLSPAADTIKQDVRDFWKGIDMNVSRFLLLRLFQHLPQEN
jgi:hypothetical protein